MKNNKFKLNSKWKLLLNDLNLDITYILHTAGLPLDLLTRKDATLYPCDFFKLWEIIESTAKPIDIALYLGRKITTESFSPAVLACICSTNLEKALTRLSQYEVLISPIALDIDKDPHKINATMRCAEYDSEIPTSLILYKFVIITQIARIATRTDISPVKITLKKLPVDLKHYRSFFSSPILSSEENTISFSTKDTIQPFLTEDRMMWQYFLEGLQANVPTEPKKIDIQTRVKQTLLETLPSGLCTLDNIADRLSMSKRTLQRQLKAANISYQLILDKTRLDLSNHYLSATDISVKEIAYLIGYLDTNAFQRAYKKWTGITPYQFRTDSVYL